LSSVLLVRHIDERGEVLSPIPLAEWVHTAPGFGISISNKLTGSNPFTGHAIEFLQPGAGEWASPTGIHVVGFQCGAVLVERCDDHDRDLLGPLASALGARIHEAQTFFACQRMPLSELLRQAASGLPRESEAFTSDPELAPATLALLLLPGSAAPQPAEIAKELGYSHVLLPTDCLEQVAESAFELSPAPSDDLLVRALLHYLEHDTFLERH
jgi:hypothetical protein